MPNAKTTAKTTTTKASAQGAKKTQSKPEPKKTQSKPPVKSAATKSTTEKKPARKNLTQCVGFVYSGSLIKGSHVYLFQCDNTDAVSHVRDTLVPYFGGNLNGRYVKCEDASETMTAVLESATDKGFHTDEDCQNILKCNVGDASTLIKTCAGANIAHILKLKEEETDDKPKKTGAKTKASTTGAKGNAKKAAVVEDDAEDDEEGDEDDVSDEEEGDEEGDDEAEDEEEDEEEEEEVKPPPKKTTAAKPANAKGGKAPQKPAVRKGGK